MCHFSGPLNCNIWAVYAVQLKYSRTSPYGHPTTVDTPPLWTLFSRPVWFSLYVVCGPWPHLVSLVWTPRYCGHFLSGHLLPTLARFHCNCKYMEVMWTWLSFNFFMRVYTWLTISQISSHYFSGRIQLNMADLKAFTEEPPVNIIYKNRLNRETWSS